MALPSKLYRLSPRAESDVRGIYEYTAETWSVRQADTYLDELVSAFQGLASGLRKGQSVLTHPGMMKLAVGSHIVFYRDRGDRLDVIRVLHQAMDVPTHL